LSDDNPRNKPSLSGNGDNQLPVDKSQQEWLDIVDENDNITGRATRKDIHRLKLMHRSVHIMLHDSRGSWFVQKRSLLKSTGAGLWDASVAGHVDSGETYRQCALREISEELGIQILDSALVRCGKLRPSAANGFEFTDMFLFTSDAELTLEPDEIDDGRWLRADDLTAWLAASPHEFTRLFQSVWHHARRACPDRSG
jgi:16S rRNA (adenine1518-N6/adenine1519-N6)-dimethyltransferase